MIALWRSSGAAPFSHRERVAASLGLFAGRPADSHAEGSFAFWRLDGPRPTRNIRGWRPTAGPDGSRVLFHGWIDNDQELASELGMRGRDPADIYAAAVARFGRDADARIHGSYCSIVVRPDGSVRLARSPWSAPPLAYVVRDDWIMAASVPRALFAAGHESELNHNRVIDSLLLDLSRTEEGWFKGVARAPHGAIVEISPAPQSPRVRVDRWYDPQALPKVRLPRDEDYVDATNALLAESVSKALRAPRRPGVKLSGGLDSSTVTAEILRQLPPERTLDSFTFVPHRDWDGAIQADLMGDERPFVEAFARQHPRLRTHFTDNVDGGFDARERDFFIAMSGTPAHISLYHNYQGIWHDARDAGCDWLLHAEFGNHSFSNAGTWSYREDLLRGHWRQLYMTLSRRRGDPRPFWRKLLAMSILPLFPMGIIDRVRRAFHPKHDSFSRLATLLTDDAIAQREMRTPLAAVRNRFTVATRREYIAAVYAAFDFEGAEIWQGFEQIFGLRQRDVTAYRPLIEFCLGMPTRQFVSHGEERWLAKRMAVGKMPEAQRLNERYGRHGADWHARLTPRRAELAQEAEQLRKHPWLGEVLDIDRMQRLLEDWPATTPLDFEECQPREGAITRAILAGRFVRFVEGRNDL